MSYLRLLEWHNALQLPVFLFLLFFCQPCLGLCSCKSVFLILKISQNGGPKRWVQLLSRCSCKNWYKKWYHHFHKTYDYQIWQAGASRGVNSNGTNQPGAGDVITSRLNNKLKPIYLYYNSAYGHQTWQDDDFEQPLSILLHISITWSCKITR